MGTLGPCRGQDWSLRDHQPSPCLEFQKQGSGIGGVCSTQSPGKDELKSKARGPKGLIQGCQDA